EIPLTAEQHDFLVVDSDEEWEEGELNANCIFMTKLQATSTNTDNNHVYDTVTPYEVLNFDNYYDNRIYNMFSHEEQHSELPESSQGTYVEQHYDSNIMVETIDVDFSGGDVKQYAVNNEETNAYCETLLNNFKVEIDRCLMVNHKDKASSPVNMEHCLKAHVATFDEGRVSCEQDAIFLSGMGLLVPRYTQLLARVQRTLTNGFFSLLAFSHLVPRSQ
ncbi:hypothetical protein Tco_0625676, partial [Tanacetum coccineum]